MGQIQGCSIFSQARGSFKREGDKGKKTKGKKERYKKTKGKKKRISGGKKMGNRNQKKDYGKPFKGWG